MLYIHAIAKHIRAVFFIFAHLLLSNVQSVCTAHDISKQAYRQ